MMGNELLSNKYNKCYACGTPDATKYYRYKIRNTNYALCEKCMSKMEEDKRQLDLYKYLEAPYKDLDTEEYLKLHYDFEIL